MKKKTRTFAIIAGLALLCGCASQDIPFTKTPTVFNGVTNYVYDVSPPVSNALYTAGQLNKSFVPAPFNGIVEVGLGAIALLLAGLARYKTQQANTQRAAADLLASQVVQSGQQTQALQKSLSTPSAQAVAEHIDNNTPY